MIGLDTFARREDTAAFEAADLHLCGHGSDGSKVYSDLVETVTGVSLYQEWIEPTVVAGMYAKIRAH